MFYSTHICKSYQNRIQKSANLKKGIIGKTLHFGRAK